MSYNHCPQCGTNPPEGPNAYLNRIERALKYFALVCSLIVVVITLFFSILPSYQREQDAGKLMAARPEMSSVAMTVSERLGVIEDNAILLAESLRHHLELEPSNPSDLKILLERFIEANPEVMFTYTGLPDQGMIIAPDTELPSDYDPRIRPWYQDAVAAKKLLWTPFYHDPTNNQMIATLTKPLFSELAADYSKFRCLGVFGADILYTEILRQSVRDNQTPSQPHGLFIIDNRGALLYHENAQLIGQIAPYDALVEAIRYGHEGLLQVQTAKGYFTCDIMRLVGRDLYVVAMLH